MHPFSPMTTSASQNRKTPRLLQRYVALHMGSTWNDIKTRHRWWQRLLGEVVDTEPSAPNTAHLSWIEAVVRYRYAVPSLRRNYTHWAWQARGFALGTILALLIGGHRLWLADWGGGLASLACALLCAAFALIPAYRCWQIRGHTLSPLREFLRQPQYWWPVSLQLPPDYTLHPEPPGRAASSHTGG